VKVLKRSVHACAEAQSFIPQGLDIQHLAQSSCPQSIGTRIDLCWRIGAIGPNATAV
jgi:hypothetical protein